MLCRHLYYKSKISANEFIESFLKLFKPEMQLTAYNIWPQFIRTVQNQETRHELDAVYLQALKSNLPKKVPLFDDSEQQPYTLKQEVL
jgi:hypothetical protein